MRLRVWVCGGYECEVSGSMLVRVSMRVNVRVGMGVSVGVQM